uniref:Rhodanese domain-containing protein n=1 Tax=Glossina morsitans morsitans TaxID=37546 RepID=A0ABK9NFV8_GLOMM
MATFEEVRNVPNHPEVYLIDVRNADEVAKTGSIPASINIPLPDLEDALKMSEKNFQHRYKRDKPSKDSVIIFTCMSGKRAQKSTDLARSYGFKRAKTYHGSWSEWSKKQGL